jgi:hypothetical protein
VQALPRASRSAAAVARASSFSCRATLLSISRKPRRVTRLRCGLIGRSGRATTPESPSSSLTKARLIAAATVDRGYAPRQRDDATSESKDGRQPCQLVELGHCRVIGHRADLVRDLEDERQKIHVADRVQEKPRTSQYPVDRRANIRLVLQGLIPCLSVAGGAGCPGSARQRLDRLDGNVALRACAAARSTSGTRDGTQ